MLFSSPKRKAMEKTIVTFGEVMGRLCPPGFLRLTQCLPGSLDVTFAGAEANVAASISMLGGSARFVTALPDHDLSEACLQKLRGLGIDTSCIVKTDRGRLGLYFVETGANQRPSRVVYDREGSSVSLTPGEAYDWEATLEGAGWLHFTGITPALSATAAEACRTAATAARAKGLTVSTDLNFRKKLWNWEPGTAPRELAERTMRSLLPLVDVVVANEEDAGDVLSIHAENTDVQAGRIDAARYVSVAQQIVAQFPTVSRVAITLRESVSASHNNWGGMLFDGPTGEVAFAPLGPESEYAPYEIRNIVDRVGGGDSFAASLIFALNSPDLCGRLQDAIDFAVAGSCLAHSIYGDFNYTTRDEVMALLKTGGSGRVVR